MPTFDVHAWLRHVVAEAQRESVPVDEWSCSWVFRGPQCQYKGADKFCTGTFADCRSKGNAIHFGGLPRRPTDL